MKKILIGLLAMMMTSWAGIPNAQASELSGGDRSEASSELNKKASKAARKEAKKLTKEGWLTSPGTLPLEKQLDKSL